MNIVLILIPVCIILGALIPKYFEFRTRDDKSKVEMMDSKSSLKFMYYLKDYSTDDPGLTSYYENLYILLLEIDESGKVNREIGLDTQNNIIHIYPDRTFHQKYKYGSYGINDLAVFDANTLSDNCTSEEFNNTWDEYVKQEQNE